MLLVFCAGVIWAIAAEPELFDRLDFRWVLLILFVGVPFTVVLNIVRYYLVGRMLEQRLTLRAATLVVLVGRAASLLPIPGGLMVRAAGLSENGERYSAALMANLTSSALWFGLAGLYSGASAFVLGRVLLGGVLVAVGAVFCTAGAVYMVRCWQPRVFIIASLIAANLLLLGIATARYWMCLEAFGMHYGLAAAAVLSLSGPVGVIVGLSPGGLGIAEGAAALLAQLVGLAAMEGFMLAALNRVVADAAMLPLTIGLYLRRGPAQIRVREPGK